jgi:HD-like signal output (HDOD) protein/CheY-like chemotaxis protein
MCQILVVAEGALVRDPITTNLRLAGYETDAATTGREGVSRARAVHPDLILLDGIALAGVFRADPATKSLPIILLSAEADRDTVMKAAQLGIKDFVLKSRFSMDDILSRIRKYVNKNSPSPVCAKPVPPPPQADLPQLLTKDQCLSRLENAISAKPLSGVIAQVMSMASSPTAELTELVTLISRDPVLSTRLLRVANSAAFAGAKKAVTSVQDSIRIIGVSTVRNVAVSLGVLDALPGCGDESDRMRSWQHSFATAMICQHLVDVCPDSALAGPGVAYLVGLCHDLGQILFRTEFAKEYAEVLKAHEQTRRSLESIEREMLGATQLDVVRLILRRLSLPDGIRSPIEEFQSLRQNHAKQLEQPLARLLRIAKPYANGILMAASPCAVVGLLTKSECKLACGRESPARPDTVDLRGQILAITPLVARLSQTAEGKLQQPLVPHTGSHICLVRDAGLSEFDPVEAALRSISDLDVSSDFPPDEAEYQAIVMAARQRNPLPINLAVPVLRLALDLPEGAKPVESTSCRMEECGPMISLERLAAFISRPLVAISRAA